MRDRSYYNITLRNMEIFLTVARHQNMRKAAEELFVTQPLLSQKIGALESLYPVPFFTYNKLTILPK